MPAEEPKKGFFHFLRGRAAKPDIVRDSQLETRERLVSVEPGPLPEGHKVVKQDIVRDTQLETREKLVTVEQTDFPEGHHVVKQDKVRDSLLDRQDV